MSFVGGTIGPYQILDKLGAGGMGEVYRARDARLNRDVAIKVLPAAFAGDADRLARFTREAQVLASLNHPNIAGIYGIEANALVMELVSGEDLSAIIARGPVPLPEVLALAKQIADALEAAHEQGIVHRDLKPGNIKVRPDGTVKVLDFGLAKALDATASGAPSDAMNSPTLTAAAFAHGGPGTQMGMILGTAAYMSPEQARGKTVDRRADIWAFGVVLYEMLTGRRAFQGDDVSITLASVLKDEPKWQALPAGLPAPLHRLLRRCLEKDPKRRLSSIADARLELEEREIEASTAVTAARPAGPSSRSGMLSRLWPFLAGAALAAIVAYVLWPSTVTAPVASGGLARLSMLPPPGARLYPDSTGAAISPDGTMVAYVVGSVARSETQLWVRSLASRVARRLEDADGANLPFWSPDSTRIAFFTATKLRIVSVSGGRAETIADAPGPRGGTWNASNVIVYAPDAGGPLFKISVRGGKPEPVTTIDPARKEIGHRFPKFLPDGDHFLYAALPGHDGKFEIFAGSLQDTSRVSIGAMEAAPVFADPGWLLYARQGVLTAQPFDPVALRVTGEPVTLEDEPSSILEPTISFTAGTSVSVSMNGSLAYYSAPSMNTIATWYDAAGVTLGTLNLPPGHYDAVRISPDGTRGVAVKSTSPSESSVWLVDLARGGARPLSSGPGRNDSPVWSPDGARVVWAADRDGAQNLFVKNVNDAMPEKQLYGSDVLFKAPLAWSPDGKSVLMVQLDPGTAQNIWLLDASGAIPPTPLVQGRARDMARPVSPNGMWFLFVSDESGRYELYAQSFPAAGRRTQISESSAILGWWSKDGRRVVFIDSDFRGLWRADAQPGDALRFGTPTRIATLPPDIVSVDAMPDLQRFLAISPERTGTGSVTVVQNWRAALAGRR